jgi:hypothetical protein
LLFEQLKQGSVWLREQVAKQIDVLLRTGLLAAARVQLRELRV